MAFLIDPKNVSYESIRQSLIDYVKSRESGAAWKDFYEGSTGVVIIELMAAMMTYLQYIAAVNRRESYLTYAQNKSSMTAISEMLGYSVYRGQNPHFDCSLVLGTTVSFPKLSTVNTPLGTYAGYGIYPLEPVVFNAGVSTPVKLGVGTLKTETITIENSSPNVFRFLTPNVSEDVSVVMAKDQSDLDTLASYNDETKIFEWPLSKYLSDLPDLYSVVMTNAVGSVDVFSLNNMLKSNGDPVLYGTEFNLLQLKYLEFNPLVISWEQFAANAKWNYGASSHVDLTASHTSEVAIERSTRDEIRVNAPLAHETQLIVRGREDYPKLLQLELNDNYGDCTGTKGHDVSAAIVELGYVLKKDGVLHMLTPADVLELEEGYFAKCRPFGVMPPLIGPISDINDAAGVNVRKYARAKAGGGYENAWHSVRLFGTIALTVSKISMLGLTTAQVEEDLLGVLDPYYYKLQGAFDLEKIEYGIEQLSWVRTAKITLTDYALWTETPPVGHTAPEIASIQTLTDSQWDWFYRYNDTAHIGTGADITYSIRLV